MANKNIVFLSGADTSDNVKALRYISTTYPKFKKVCYIPAHSEGSAAEYKQAKKDFKKYLKADLVELVLLEEETSANIKKKMNKADILFFGGGNTFQFYDELKKHRLSTALKSHLKKGKLIVGLSAGGILLTPSLLMACYPSQDADDCSNSRENFKSLGFVSFEICPHYKSSKNMKKDLMVYSSLHKPPVYGIRDGDFIAVSEEGMYFSSKVEMFFRGEQVSWN